MRFSITHKFCFVHVPKTAGTSVQKILEPYYDKRPPIKKIRRLLTNLPVRENYDYALVRPHYTARWARLKYGADFFDQMYSFAFVRNPFDLMVSRYEFIRSAHWHHRHKMMQVMSFSDFLSWEAKRHRIIKQDQTSYVVGFDGKMLVDELYRFEMFDTEVKRLAKAIGIKEPETIPWMKKRERRHYSKYFSKRDVELVKRIYRRDMENFSYQFDPE